MTAPNLPTIRAHVRSTMTGSQPDYTWEDRSGRHWSSQELVDLPEDSWVDDIAQWDGDALHLVDAIYFEREGEGRKAPWPALVRHKAAAGSGARR